MRLWDFILSNPLILLLIGGFVLSNLGDWLQRLTKVTRERRQRQARALRPDADWAGRGQSGGAEPAVDPRAARRETAAKSREELAAQMRQLMGLEAPPKAVKVEAPAPVRDFVIESIEPADNDSERRSHGVRGGLAEEMAQRDVEGRQRKRTAIEEREMERELEREEKEERVRDRHLPEHHSDLEQDDEVKPWGSRRRKDGQARHLFDRRDVARAIVAREVLGEPRGVRGWDA